MEYWEECIGEAFEDAKIVATDEQIATVASWIEGAHDNYGMAHGHDCIPNPLQTELDELHRKFDKSNEISEQRFADREKEFSDRTRWARIQKDRVIDELREELDRR